MPAAAKPRWITICQPFDYRWHHAAVTAFRHMGPYFAKAEVADFAVGKGYATEGKADGAACSQKGGKKRIRRASKKGIPAATATDAGPATPVDHQGPVDADRAADRPAVDHDAG